LRFWNPAISTTGSVLRDTGGGGKVIPHPDKGK
ncbi:hypothetical protein Tco_0632244, partial [Tanacetum coccineum]